MTLYNGFLVKDGQATIEDAMRHLDHAISVMGIDHVGLGTDFDGDGGICGLASSSELLNFTRQLLERSGIQAVVLIEIGCIALAQRYHAWHASLLGIVKAVFKAKGIDGIGVFIIVGRVY